MKDELTEILERISRNVAGGGFSDDDVKALECASDGLNSISEKDLLALREAALRSNAIIRAASKGLASARRTLEQRGAGSRIYDRLGSSAEIGHAKSRHTLNF